MAWRIAAGILNAGANLARPATRIFSDGAGIAPFGSTRRCPVWLIVEDSASATLPRTTAATVLRHHGELFAYLPSSSDLAAVLRASSPTTLDTATGDEHGLAQVYCVFVSRAADALDSSPRPTTIAATPPLVSFSRVIVESISAALPWTPTTLRWPSPAARTVPDGMLVGRATRRRTSPARFSDFIYSALQCTKMVLRLPVLPPTTRSVVGAGVLPIIDAGMPPIGALCAAAAVPPSPDEAAPGLFNLLLPKAPENSVRAIGRVSRQSNWRESSLLLGVGLPRSDGRRPLSVADGYRVFSSTPRAEHLDSSPTETPNPQAESYVDENFELEITNAATFFKSNPILLKMIVTSSGATFWRLSDKKAARMIRSLARTLRRQHEKGRSLVTSLSVNNVMVTSFCGVKLSNELFDDHDFSWDRVKQDYKYMAAFLEELITMSEGEDGLIRAPPDFTEYLDLLRNDQLEPEDQYLIDNHLSLIPMSNRADAFLAMYQHITGIIARKDKNTVETITSNLPCKDWFATAKKNTRISKYMNRRQYKDTPEEFLTLNRHVRCHKFERTLSDIEKDLYGEWPKLLVNMQKQLHGKGELEKLQLELKFGN